MDVDFLHPRPLFVLDDLEVEENIVIERNTGTQCANLVLHRRVFVCDVYQDINIQFANPLRLYDGWRSLFQEELPGTAE